MEGLVVTLHGGFGVERQIELVAASPLRTTLRQPPMLIHTPLHFPRLQM